MEPEPRALPSHFGGLGPRSDSGMASTARDHHGPESGNGRVPRALRNAWRSAVPEMSIADCFFNEDCVEGCVRRVADGGVDLIITDPPYGIGGGELHKHYNRKEEYVLDGYVEVPRDEYAGFSANWIREAERILRPGGSIYVVSGYTNLVHILNALRSTRLQEVNHVVWKYNFGVYTKRKFISSHYHVLYYVKPGGPVTFNAHCRCGPHEKTPDNRSMNYADREDVWIINREYKPGRKKNKNELPTQLLVKLIQYSSNEGDLVCDLFLGSFSTAKVALGLNRRALGFEISKVAFEHQMKEMQRIVPGSLLRGLREPEESRLPKQGKPWADSDKSAVWGVYQRLLARGGTKKSAVETLCKEFGRGKWSIEKVLGQMESKERERKQLELFATN